MGSPNCWESSGHIIEQTISSAGVWANFRNLPNSVKYQSRAMLNEAAKIVSDPADKKIKLAFTSVPKKFITTYSEFEVCEKEFQKTTKSPILFNDLKFKEVDEVVNWFSAFSQGSGNEGKRLYQECPGSCSPQYCLEISDSEGRLQVNASVICGHARDKNDGSYRMILRRE